MDVVKFIEERNRMCRHFDNGCYECPAFNTTCENELLYCAVGQESTMDAKAQIAIVEKWSKENPRKTRQSKFLKLFPEADVGGDGCLTLNPCEFYQKMRKECTNKYNWCADCRHKFWNQEVE